jgi:hypothetical protein
LNRAPRKRRRLNWPAAGAQRSFRFTATAAAMALGMLQFPAAAQRLKAPRTKPSAGFLTCNVAGGFGFIFGSTRDVVCTYATVDGRTDEYKGRIDKYGADIGYLSSAVMLWGVYSQNMHLGPGSLAGDYAGVAGSATLGVGGGFQILIGGSEKSITLQPLSIEGNKGLNVAAGVMTLHLEFVKTLQAAPTPSPSPEPSP